METQQIQQLIDMAQNGIATMAEGMGVAVPQLWEILIRQQYVEAITSIFAMLLFTSIALLAIRILLKIKDWEEGPTPRQLIGVALIVIAFIGLLVSFMDFFPGGTIGKLINPEYYAIKDIAEFINPTNN